MIEQNRKPLGVIIFGSLNCFFFGIFLTFSSIIVYCGITPQAYSQINELLSRQGLNSAIPYEQYKIKLLLMAVLSFVFFISGLGLVIKREWGRKLTVYYSFALLIWMVIKAITAPSFIDTAFIRALYPAALIFYFTGKRVTQFFET
jgi:hypothetical protein